MFVIKNESLPWQDRMRFLKSFINIYKDIFAPFYGDTVFDNNTCVPTFSCFMLWDVIPIYGAMDHPDNLKINIIIIDIFAQVLEMKEEVCLFSDLHGLGHWQIYFPESVEPIAKKFLARSDLNSRVRAYAEHAAIGITP